MTPWLRFIDRLLRGLTRLLLRFALAVEDVRRLVPRHARRWRRGLRGFYRRWVARELTPPPFIPRRRGGPAANRTPALVEDRIVRLHVEQPLLGAGQLRRLAERVLGFHACRETFRKILIRRHDLIAALAAEKRKRRRIVVRRALALWGADLTLVWVLGFVRGWILGVVDYHGSRLVAFRRLPWPTASAVASSLEQTIAEHGAPARILTDRAPVLRAPAVADLLERRGIEHTLTRPAHPWTNGRIERINRTFKETVFKLVWLVASVRQIDRFCADFVTWYNRDRPHSTYDGKTPDEVYFGRPQQRRSLGRVAYFDGRLACYRFG